MKTNGQDALKALLDAISPDDVESPNIPISVALQEARDLERTAQGSWATLEGVGAEAAWLTALPILTAHLEDKEAAWGKVRYSGRTREEQRLTEKGEWIRGEFHAAGAYAFGGDDALMARLARIREGEGFADLLQDLRELHALWLEQQLAFAAIGFDATLGEAAKVTAEELSAMRAAFVSAKALDDSKIERDRAWTALNSVMDRLRGAGLYAFRNDPDRLAAFRSRYALQAGRRSRQKRARVAGSATVPTTTTVGAPTPSNPTR